MTAVRIELTREELLALIREGVRAELGRKVDVAPPPAEDPAPTAEDYARLRAFRRKRGRRG